MERMADRTINTLCGFDYYITAGPYTDPLLPL